MEIVIELLLTFIAEFVGPLMVEILAELGIRSASHTLDLERPKNSALALLGYILLAAMFAVLSLFLSTKLYIQNPMLQIINLIVTPLLIGWIMSIRRRKLLFNKNEVIRLNSFWYGFVFALTFVCIRYFALRNYDI